jgi:hypothetical protein
VLVVQRKGKEAARSNWNLFIASHVPAGIAAAKRAERKPCAGSVAFALRRAVSDRHIGPI